MQNKISIIVNCFNGEKFLQNCLDSINNQTYKNYEVIFWDNKSEDNSKKIFLSYNNFRFRYFLSKQFTNLSEARNQALKLATGDFITFIDVDDMWLETKLEKQLLFLQKNNYDVSYSNYFIKDENNKNNGKLSRYLNILPKKNFIENLLNNYFISISTVMFCKNKIHNFFFNNKYHLIGDYDFIMRCSTSYKIGGISEPLSIIRFHQTNETSKYFLKNIFETKVWYNLNKDNFSTYKNYKNIKSNFRYNLLKYFIINNKYKKPLKFFFYINLLKKIKIIFLFLKKFYVNIFQLNNFL